MKQSLKKRAQQASGRAKCDNCPFIKGCNPTFLDICHNAFVAGFTKGYATAKKDIKKQNNQ